MEKERQWYLAKIKTFFQAVIYTRAGEGMMKDVDELYGNQQKRDPHGLINSWNILCRIYDHHQPFSDSLFH